MLALAIIVPPRTKLKVTLLMCQAVGNAQVVINFVFIHGIKTKEPIGR